jgi:hypothetical protein
MRNVSLRSGAVILEVILTLPLLVIASVAVLELGLLASGQQAIEAASFDGAVVASRDANMAANVTVPADIVDAVENSLASRGVPATVGNGQLTIVLDSSELTSTPLSVGENLSIAPLVAPANRPFVRVVVGVRGVALAPNALATFGLDLTDVLAVQETTLAYTP